MNFKHDRKTIELITVLRKQGFTIRAIAKALNMPVATVAYWVNRDSKLLRRRLLYNDNENFRQKILNAAKKYQKNNRQKRAEYMRRYRARKKGVFPKI